MGVKNWIAKAGGKAADKVAKLAVLSPEQLSEVQKNREKYLSQMPDMNDEAAVELTSRLLAACSTEIYNSYLDQLEDYYVPVAKDFEYDSPFDASHNIRFFNITKWVTDRKENNIEKLVNVYEVLSNEECNIALIFDRKMDKTRVYLAVVNTKNAESNVDADNYKSRLIDAIKGNFPGSEWSEEGTGVVPCLNNNDPYSVACASNIPAEKSEKFISQTIEKLLDGIVPDSKKKEYTIVLLATPVTDVENRKIHLAELYSGLAPYARWETSFTFTESDSTNSNATFGVNVGASAGVQHGQNQAETRSRGETDSSSQTQTESETRGETDSTGTSESDTKGTTATESNSTSNGTSDTQSDSHTDSRTGTHTEGTNQSDSESTNSSPNILEGLWHKVIGGEVGTGESHSSGSSVTDAVSEAFSDMKGSAHADTFNETKGKSIAENIARTVAKTTSKAITNTTGRSIANTLGNAVTNTLSKTTGLYKGVNLGANVGANFARSSNVTATVGKNEGITQHFTNYNIKHLLENLEIQMKRYEQSVALGMWDFAAYVLSEDQNVANNVAYSYLALTQGEQSYMAKTAVNLWRGDMGERSNDAKEICSYIRELRHPVFALSPALTEEVPISNVYPAIVTPTTSLSGKELAYSLNFPQKSIAGLPVINCTEFGRDIVSYDLVDSPKKQINLGKVFHMNHIESVDTDISLNSLASHVFISGSTGSGKSNTVYKIIEESRKNGIKFMVIEPAKGEYKNVFGNDADVQVYGTNPSISELLRINPFSFPKKIHIYEHMDRLVEIFNVCWPMYAAMPAVLKNAIERSYEDCGWNLIDSINEYGDSYYPTFADVARNIRDIIDTSEYDTENKGAYKGSLLTRLQSLSNGINGQVFTTNEIKAENLFDRNVIVDISRVGSTETKSLIMGMLVLKLQEYRIAGVEKINNPLMHITVLEEAHNILKRTSTEQPVEGGNLIGKSVEMISNAIAEMRTYGEGFIVVDQAPGLMDMSAIRNTNTKIIMRLPDQNDRELVGKAANLNDEQIKELAKLPCGVAAVYQNEWIQPVLCKVDKVEITEDLYCFNQSKDSNRRETTFEDKLYIAEILSKGMALGKELNRDVIVDKLKDLQLSDYDTITILKMLENPPKEPNMTRLAPVVHALFPDITKIIKKAYINETNETEWTREANELLIKYKLDDQVRRDIIQASITYYLVTETNNKTSLENWIQKGGLR